MVKCDFRLLVSEIGELTHDMFAFSMLLKDSDDK